MIWDCEPDKDYSCYPSITNKPVKVSGCQQASHQKIAQPVASVEVYKLETSYKKTANSSRARYISLDNILF
jgi:hypothetical protein